MDCGLHHRVGSGESDRSPDVPATRSGGQALCVPAQLTFPAPASAAGQEPRAPLWPLEEPRPKPFPPHNERQAGCVLVLGGQQVLQSAAGMLARRLAVACPLLLRLPTRWASRCLGPLEGLLHPPRVRGGSSAPAQGWGQGNSLWDEALQSRPLLGSPGLGAGGTAGRGGGWVCRQLLPTPLHIRLGCIPRRQSGNSLLHLLSCTGRASLLAACPLPASLPPPWVWFPSAAPRAEAPESLRSGSRVA